MGRSPGRRYLHRRSFVPINHRRRGKPLSLRHPLSRFTTKSARNRTPVPACQPLTSTRPQALFSVTLRPDFTILQALLEAGPDGVVSGADLARRLGVSRVAVWQHLEKIRDQGFVIESLHARGYRLASSPTFLHPALLDAHRRPGPGDARIHFYDTIGSTNDEAARLLAAGESAPLVVLSRRQDKGRGRLGRSWHSATEGNLYLSFAFRPDVEPAHMQTFTLWMGVNVCLLVATFCRVVPGLKLSLIHI